MSFIEIPEFPVLRGERAIEALKEYIREFEERKGKGLTRKQARTLIKFAQGLIDAIEAETESNTSRSNSVVRPSFVINLKRIFTATKQH